MPTSTLAAPPRPSRRRQALSAGLAVLFCLCAALQAPADLSADVSARVNRALEANTPKGATVGIQLIALGESASQRSVLFSSSADRPMIPASNLKLLTTAAALDTLGKDFKFQTRLLIRGDASTGEVELAVIGDGDPSFGDAALLKNIDGWGTRSVLTRWANLLSQQGISRVSALWLDDGVFDEQYVHPNWPLNQRHRWYEAQVGGLNLNINCLDVYVYRNGGGGLMGYRLDPPTAYVNVSNSCRAGTKNAVSLTRPEGTNAISLSGQTNAREQGPMQVTVDGPTAYFGTVFSEALREAGITSHAPVVDRTIRHAWESRQSAQPTEGPEAGWRLFAVHETDMATVLARTNKDSINLYAEALAKRTAFAATGEPGSWAAAERVVKNYLARIGMEADHVRLDDGSGMSREDRVTAAALCDVLASMHDSDAADVFRDSLSEAGVDGTLQRRFRGGDRSDLHGRVFGKTGYISGVCTFSGYLHGRDGRWYAFSILVNDSNELWKAQALQEAVILALDRSLPASAATAEAR